MTDAPETTRPVDAPAADDRTGRPSFRGDVDGLRAVAIVIVVLFHARVVGFGGGFVGVDVFFVISGFLITRNLLAEVGRTSRVSLSSFWAKRIRRLVPAMALMVVTTLVASLVILPLIQMPTVAKQAGAANLYVSNILFAVEAGDYFGPALEQSPYLHTWSLGVEEQFYVLWPILLGIVAWTVRRRPDRVRTVLVPVFAITAVASLALSVMLARTSDPWGFFGLPSRWWEFAVAGILAAVPVPAVLRRRRVGDLLAGAGLALIALATVVIEAGATYPGAKATVPVLGTVLVLIGAGRAADGSPGVVGRALSAPALQWLGRVSYSWYLWHWPFMVLAAHLFTDSTADRLVAGLVALPVAALTHRSFETPIRFAPFLTRSKARTFGAAIAVTALVATGCFAVTRTSTDQVAGSDFDQELLAARKDARTDPCEHRAETSTGISYCEGGDLTSDRVVLLTGDSHARHWKVALLEVARANDIRVVDSWGQSCPVIPVVTADRGNDKGVACAQLRGELPGLIDELEPDVVLVSEGGFYLTRLEVDGERVDGERAEEAWAEAFRSWMTSVTDAGAQPAVIFDNPGLNDDPVVCVAETRSTEECSVEEDELPDSQRRTRAVEEAVVAEMGDVPSFGTTGLICREGVCDIARDGVMIYVDIGHLSQEFTRSLHEELLAFLEAALAGTGGHFGDRP